MMQGREALGLFLSIFSQGIINALICGGEASYDVWL